MEFCRLRFSPRPKISTAALLDAVKRGLSGSLPRFQGQWEDVVAPSSNEELRRFSEQVRRETGGETGRKIAYLFMSIDSEVTLGILKRHQSDWVKKIADWLPYTHAFYAGQLLSGPEEIADGAQAWISSRASKVGIARNLEELAPIIDDARRYLEENPPLKASITELLAGQELRQGELAAFLNPRRRALRRIARLLKTNDGELRDGPSRQLAVFVTHLHPHYYRWERYPLKELFISVLMWHVSNEMLGRAASAATEALGRSFPSIPLIK